MSEIERSELRVGDAEREDAIRALGEHMSAGRLDVDEYGERSARITTAKTRGELVALFTDLPDPKPAFGAPQPPPTPAHSPVPVPPRALNDWQSRPVGQRVFAALIPLSAITGVLLFISFVHFWPILLLPVAMTAIGGALFGDDWRQDQRGNRRGRRDMRHYRGHYGRGWR
ncbi:DUF1707 domain-containing protein [Actinokineospora auranticolor]|uniref:Uncharacterized protein DUF1707 n=1 Tax=Actinokineospora auranticolor TaxID=155976 RepID=A0A2S6GX08_9PSEU|nr:DUF1707 domain-containing protein [Actinokineospora auranticolor]PPK69764.1 uncharacterized protein DUF1707 [Actinokineospora auranticolor]